MRQYGYYANFDFEKCTIEVMHVLNRPYRNVKVKFRQYKMYNFQQSLEHTTTQGQNSRLKMRTFIKSAPLGYEVNKQY